MDAKLFRKMVLQLLPFPVFMGALLFLPAGTLDYWQAWVFAGVFFVCSLVIALWLARADPKLLERRMNVGPAAETEASQKVIIVLAQLCFAASCVMPALDHRFGWSHVPTAVVVLGDVLIVLSNVAFAFVFRENSYGAANIQVMEDQHVISTGPYAIVRHPMYAGAVLLMPGIPLALGSWWGLLIAVPFVAVLVWRILDEERFPSERLAGYRDDARRVRYRLVPYLW